MTDFILWVRPECFHGTPLMFLRMRSALARAAGIPVTPLVVEADGEEITLYAPDLNSYALTEDNLMGVWETPPDDPILYLLAHSDEGGVIQDEHMLPLCERMSELEPIAWKQVSDSHGETDGTQVSSMIQTFARGLANAYTARKPVEFRLQEYHP